MSERVKEGGGICNFLIHTNWLGFRNLFPISHFLHMYIYIYTHTHFNSLDFPDQDCQKNPPKGPFVVNNRQGNTKPDEKKKKMPLY